LHFLVSGWFEDKVFRVQCSGQQINLANRQVEILGRVHKLSPVHLISRTFTACQSEQIRVGNFKTFGKLSQRFLVRGSLFPEFRHQRANGFFIAGWLGVNVFFSRTHGLFGNYRLFGSGFRSGAGSFFRFGFSHEHTF